MILLPLTFDKCARRIDVHSVLTNQVVFANLLKKLLTWQDMAC